MPEFSETAILSLFSQYAYRPGAVYGLIIAFMFASSFGLPIPEELVLITAGLVAYMAHDRASFPPPTPDAVSVNIFTLAVVCFLAVFISDLLVFLIGKYFGARIVQSKFFKKRISSSLSDRVNLWFNKYGGWAVGFFRFTPGLRFVGHMSCGLLGVPIWKFIVVDGLAALISVPTQVILVGIYGNIVLQKMKEFKLIVLAAILIGSIFFILKRFRRSR